MRKGLLLVLVAALLCPLAASGAENTQYLALTFAGCPAEGDTQRLLEGLESRGIRATFFLPPEDCSRSALLRDGGQELGILCDADPERSRREMAKEIRDIRDKLPPKARVRFVLHRGRDSVGFRQVAEALGLVIVQPTTEMDRAADGDILLLDARLPVEELLYQIDRLQRRGFTLVNLSELTRLRNMKF